MKKVNVMIFKQSSPNFTYFINTIEKYNELYKA